MDPKEGPKRGLKCRKKDPGTERVEEKRNSKKIFLERTIE